MKVLLYLKRNEQGENGLCPLMGRIQIKGRMNSTAQFSCKLKVNPKLWNATSQRCTGKSKIATFTNREIEKLLLLLRQRFNEFSEVKNTFTAEELKVAFQGIAAAQDTLMGLFSEHNNDYSMRVGVNRTKTTYYQYCNTYRILTDFLLSKYKVTDMPIKQIDEAFIENFDLYQRLDLKYKPLTIRGHLDRLKFIMKIAVYKGIIPFSPFKGYQGQRRTFKQRYLTKEELDKFIGTTFDTPNRNFTRDMFTFSVFTGICYCDMRELTEANIVKDEDGTMWIRTERQKTGTPEVVRLLELPLSIIEKYRGMAPDGKLFPMLTKESMNRHLKKMAEMCGIRADVSLHDARHTFASIVCLSQGIPIETLSKVMGHKHVATTQLYAKVTQDKIDADMSDLDFNIEGKFSLKGIDSAPSTIRKDMSNRKVRPSRKQIEIINKSKED